MPESSKEIARMVIRKTVQVTYRDGTSAVIRDCDVSDKPLSDRALLYAVEFNVNHEEITEDHQRFTL